MSTAVSELLGGERVLGPSLKSNLDLAHATREGLPAQTARELAVLILGKEPTSIADALVWGPWLAESDAPHRRLGPLGTLIDSLTDYPAGQFLTRLSPANSDIVVRTATAMARAIDVLGDRTKAAHWLTTPNRALGGEVPITLLDTSAGAHEVEALLDRIEYGVYS
jgi:hypothetical protein